MLSSRSQMEAFNLVAAQLTASRAEAITSDTYVGIHVQLGDQNDERMENTTYSMIVGILPDDLKSNNPVFKRWSTFVPQELPGATALGQLTAEYIDANTDKYKDIGTDNQLRQFCAFSVIFAPSGSVATKVQGNNIMFDANDLMFKQGDERQLWDHSVANNKRGITAFTMFDYIKVQKLDKADREEYLLQNGQFLPVNMHTGQLFDRY
jgi:hypothetical protein